MAYDAFISYSHGADLDLAKVMRDGLQKLAKPWNRRRALDIFLDQSSLELSSELGSSLDKRIEDTEWLVLLMSEVSAKSKWVGAEIKEWADAKSKDRMALVLTSGEVVWDERARDFDYARSTAINEGMRGIFTGQESEPLFLDMRWTKAVPEGEASLDLDNVKFRDAIATVAASIHGKSKDELEGEDIRQHRRTVRIRRIAVAALAVLTIAAVVAGIIALIQRQQAIEEANRAESRALASDASNNAEVETDLAALLALESVRVANTPDARGSLASLLSLPTRFLQRTDVHDAPLTAIAFDEEGMIAASGDENGVIRIWDVDDPLEPPQAVARDAEIVLDDAVEELFLTSEDGSEEMIAFDRQGTITYFDLSAGESFVLGSAGDFVDIAVSPEETRDIYAGVTADGQLVINELDDNLDFIPLVEPIEVGAEITGLTFSPDGSTLALGAGTELVVWPWDSDAEIWSDSLESDVLSVAFSPDGDPAAVPLVAVGEGSGNIRVYNRGNDASGVDLDPSLFNAAFDLAFKPGVDEDGAYTLASTHSNGDVILWAVYGDEGVEPFGFELETMTGHKDEALVAAFSPDGRIASGDFEGEVVWWLDEPVTSLGYFLAPTEEEVLIADAVLLQPNHAAAVDADGVAWIWSLEDDEVDAIPTEVEAISIDGAADVIALGLGDGTALLTQLDGTEIASWPAHDTPVWIVEISDDTTEVVTITAEGDELPATMAIWGATTGSTVSEPELPPDFEPMSVLHAGEFVWVGGRDGESLPVALQIDAATGQILGTIHHSARTGNGVSALAVSDDGRTLATGGTDRKISLWNAESREARTTTEFNGHRGQVRGMAFSDDDDTLISSDDAGDVLMWDVSEQRLFASLGGPARAVNSLAIDESTLTLAAAGEDGKLWLWTLDPENWRARACDLAARNMTVAEWGLYGDGGTRVRHCEQFPAPGDGDTRDANYGEALTD